MNLHAYDWDRNIQEAIVEGYMDLRYKNLPYQLKEDRDKLLQCAEQTSMFKTCNSVVNNNIILSDPWNNQKAYLDHYNNLKEKCYDICRNNIFSAYVLITYNKMMYDIIQNSIPEPYKTIKLGKIFNSNSSYFKIISKGSQNFVDIYKLKINKSTYFDNILIIYTEQSTGKIFKIIKISKSINKYNDLSQFADDISIAIKEKYKSTSHYKSNYYPYLDVDDYGNLVYPNKKFILNGYYYDFVIEVILENERLKLTFIDIELKKKIENDRKVLNKQKKMEYKERAIFKFKDEI
jgi:hypothetical protein